MYILNLTTGFDFFVISEDFLRGSINTKTYFRPGMFITQQQVVFIILVYLTIIAFVAVIVLNDRKTDFKIKVLKLLILFFLPVFGLFLLIVDLMYKKWLHKEDRI